jgi:hypothetical protein
MVMCSVGFFGGRSLENYFVKVVKIQPQNDDLPYRIK